MGGDVCRELHSTGFRPIVELGDTGRNLPWAT